MFLSPFSIGYLHQGKYFVMQKLREISKHDGMNEGENGDESDEEFIDPDSLVGQIEAQQEREEREQKLALERQRSQAHARLEPRKMKRETRKRKWLPLFIQLLSQSNCN